MYVLPGLIDMHVHLPLTDSWAGPRGREYCYKLFVAHGVTTIRIAGFSDDPRGFEDRKLSEENKIAAPRLVLMGIWPPDLYSAEEAREMVRKIKAKGCDGVKIIARPNVTSEVLEACADEVISQGMPAGVAIHIAQSCELDALDISEAGTLIDLSSPSSNMQPTIPWSRMPADCSPDARLDVSDITQLIEPPLKRFGSSLRDIVSSSPTQTASPST